MSSSPQVLRPREFALLLLATGDALPRQRVRDQQADRIGLSLKRHLLEQLIATDPEPDAVEGTLSTLAANLGGPLGPNRAIARNLLEEWRLACSHPQWQALLLDQAAQPPEPQGGRRGRQLPG